MKGVRIVGDGTIRGTQVYNLENNLRRDDISSIFILIDAESDRSLCVVTVSARPLAPNTGRVLFAEIQDQFKLELEIEDEP